MSADSPWYSVANVADLPSPALLLFRDRVARNIRKAIEIVRTPSRLRPHVKTHKMAEVIRMHLAEGVSKFKCATLAEAEMIAAAGGRDILIGNQLAGPNLKRFAELQRRFPEVRLSAICDNLRTLEEMRNLRSGKPIPVFLDLDCGMARTGIAPGTEALELYRALCGSEAIEPAGLHVYDGHIHEVEPEARRQLYNQAWAPIEELRSVLAREGLPVPAVIAGGTPTFPFHAERTDIECSPGTYVFWDFGYARFKDLPFEVAAVLITRVISKPGRNRLCLDLGHKAVASENPQPRVEFLNLPGAAPVMHSEEHLVVEGAAADRWNVGDVVYAVPRHICPTVALHDQVWVVDGAQAREQWKVTARGRKLNL